MENISACVRIKPLKASDDQDEKCFAKFEKNSIINHKTNEKFQFDHVFDETDTTLEVFNHIGMPHLDLCFIGINVCIFAYGQTSSGKTFTMKGTKDTPGLIPRSLGYVFQKLDENKKDEIELKISYIEIYNENVNDLLNPTNMNLEIRENLLKGVHIPNLTEVIIKSEDEAMQYFLQGEAARKFGETCLNEQSSRSHTVFRLSFELKPKTHPEKVIYSTLSLIDLAGSEGVFRTKAEGLRKREGANINKSLLALSNVINKLATKESTFINYRDSKLTRLLQPSLGESVRLGNSRTIVICTINPLSFNYQESMNTLKFGMNAGAIKNHVRINERSSLTKNQLKELNEFKMEWSKNKIEELEMKLNELVNENMVCFNDNSQLREQTMDLGDKIQKNEDEIDKLNKDHDQIIQLLNEIEESVKKEFDKKALEFQDTYQIIESKLKAVDAENTLLKEENSKLKQEYEKIQEINKNSIYNKTDLINDYKEHMENFKIVMESLHQEYCRKLNIEKENIQYALINNIKPRSNLIRSTPHHDSRNYPLQHQQYQYQHSQGLLQRQYHQAQPYPNINVSYYNGYDTGLYTTNGNDNAYISTSGNGSECSCNCQITDGNNQYNAMYNQMSRYGDEDFELKLLEIETNYKSQLIQKNKVLSEMNCKLLELTRELKKKDEKIFELENKIIYFKTMISTPLPSPSLSAWSTSIPISSNKDSNGDNNNSIIKHEVDGSIDDHDILGDSFIKKTKLDNYSHISKKIKTSPDKYELKKEIKYIETKNKNFERQLQKRRYIEEEYLKKIQELTQQVINLENKINSIPLGLMLQKPLGIFMLK